MLKKNTQVIKGQNLCSLRPLHSRASDTAGLLAAPSVPFTRASRLWAAARWTSDCRWAIAIWSRWTSQPSGSALLHEELMKAMNTVLLFRRPWWRGEMAPINLRDFNWAVSWCWFREDIGHVGISAQLCSVSAKYYCVYLVLLFKSWPTLYGFLQFCSSPETHLLFSFKIPFFLSPPFPQLQYKELFHSAIKPCVWFQNGKKHEFSSSDNLTSATSCSS